MTVELLQQENSLVAAEAAVEATDDRVISNPWLHVTSEVLARYYEVHTSSPDDAAALLAEAMGLQSHRSDPRKSVQIGLLMQTLKFAGDLRLPLCKAGVLLNIAQTLLRTVMDGLSLEESRQVFKNALIPLTKAASATEEASFLALEIGAISRFFAEGLYQHFKLYAFVFTRDQAVVDNEVILPLERPSIQQFDGLVMTEEEWTSHNQAVQEKREAERKAEEDQIQQQAEAEEQAQLLAAREQAEFQRQLELIRKPATLEEAIEKAVKWRVAKEKKELEDGYKSEIASLKQQLDNATAAQAPKKK